MTQKSEFEFDVSITDSLTPISLYDFLGIPPGAPANLIYLAIQKIENTDWASVEGAYGNAKFLPRIEYYIHLAKQNLLLASNREKYERLWMSYYLPSEDNTISLDKFLQRRQSSDFFRAGLRQKCLPLVLENEEIHPQNTNIFQYEKDFIYFIMHDHPENRNISPLSPEMPLELEEKKKIVFANNQFFFCNYGGTPVNISNDAIGKILTLAGYNESQIPLCIGDRLEMCDGTRYILRSLYAPSQEEGYCIPDEYLYFVRENVYIPLHQERIYIIGRNTTDIARRAGDIFRMPSEKIYEKVHFINIGRRERSISRQNVQIFYHKQSWYVQDLGSRYGTTLDIPSHCKFETLSGGAIMKLEEGNIRLGYDKSYVISVTREQQLKPKAIVQFKKTSEFSTVYDMSLLC